MEKDRYFGISKRIFPWKIQSELENLLEKNAEISQEGKYLYAAFYKQHNPDYFHQGEKWAKNLINNFSLKLNEEEFSKFYEDMVYCLHKYGFSFEDYLALQLYLKNEKGREEYIPDKLRYYYCDVLNSPALNDIMTDKYLCYKCYKEFYKRELLKIDSDTSKETFINFIKKYPDFIYKPLYDHSGHGIEIIKSEKVNIEDWFENIHKNHPGVIEELIIQGKELQEFNPSSVNTCRVITFKNKNNIDFIFVGLRMSKGNLIVDNVGSGGIIANVDPPSGVITNEGFDFNCNKYLFHPLSKVKIPGFQLPEWAQARKLVEAMVNKIEGATLTGWDIAYSNKGWLMVEANENSAWTYEQVAYGKGLKKELYQLMNEYFSSKNL